MAPLDLKTSLITDAPLISIVIAFYNIRECVDYCLKSVLEQDFPSYEVVCVDDGSTDGTSSRLDMYEGHPNVVILHKENGGLSDARNYGIVHSRGKYISIVDGDDVISPKYLSELWHALPGEDGFAVGRTKQIPFAHASASSNSWPSSYKVLPLSNQELISQYMYEETLPGAWARLARRELYLNHPFPTGVRYEEIRTAAQLVLSVKSCALVEEPIYGYVLRSGSIVHEKNVRYKQITEYLEAIEVFLSEEPFFLAGSQEEIYFRCLHYSRIVRLLDSVKDGGEYTAKIRDNCINYIKTHLNEVCSDYRVPHGNRARFRLLTTSIALYRIAFNIYDLFGRGLK